MNPGHPRILTCPFCGAEKEVLSLLSGNTFGAKTWSDNKQEAPMFPTVSYVQKCPQCTKYYIISRQKARYSESGFSEELGTLDYKEMVSAYNQLKAEGFTSKNEELGVRILLLHSYNDIQRHHNPKGIDLDDADKELYRQNMLWLIENWAGDDMMKAELYREIGEMEKAKILIGNVHPNDDFLIKIMEEITRRIEANNCDVFEITNL